ncbi:TetR/AcrR family transcriptional regulator [Anaerofustis stercorihominis]|uniref:TetR/AcrR family transcriptional regulator n=1 Tax=Anaerofustis stercorihominis TaxID=214853 RepID=UPI00210E4432|nr:TetR/AcrR family transcriptional regulator [Anaerofustis stercorihominis]
MIILKKEEKTKLTKEKIINAAVTEFGTNGYGKASINNICNENKIAKGLIYHNFKNKDEIYLTCVKMVFSKIKSFIKEKYTKTNLNDYFDIRIKFFKNNPMYSYIFFDVILNPPNHLIKEITNIKKDFDDMNKEIYKKCIFELKLRDSVNIDEALEYYDIIGNTFNIYFQKKTSMNSNFKELINEHELKLSKIIDLMLYGITDKE